MPLISKLKKVDAHSLFLLSKLLLVGGGTIALIGLVSLSHAGIFVALELLGFLAIFGGYFLRKKALTFRRRFDWREGQVTY